MSSMVRRAELQMIRRTTEPFSVWFFWIFAHFGQTSNKKIMFKNKKQQEEWNENSTHPVSDRRRGCESDRYRTGSRSLEGPDRSCLDKQQITTLWWNIRNVSWLTRQSELLLLDHRALVWEVLHDQLLQVSWRARFGFRGSQDICDGLFLLIQQKGQ